jgi:phage I-like protein
VRRILRVVDLAAGVAEGEPLPAEFRIFAAGVNETEQGPFTFDDAAAQSVMRNAALWNVDLCIDLEHRATDENAVALSDTATDAMGWFRLELREGELWAVDVRWTAEGERRLRAKLQRYISPTFVTKRADKSRSVVSVLNVALTSMPATRSATPLVAASARPTNRFDARISARARAKAAVILKRYWK